MIASSDFGDSVNDVALQWLLMRMKELKAFVSPDQPILGRDMIYSDSQHRINEHTKNFGDIVNDHAIEDNKRQSCVQVGALILELFSLQDGVVCSNPDDDVIIQLVKKVKSLELNFMHLNKDVHTAELVLQNLKQDSSDSMQSNCQMMFHLEQQSKFSHLQIPPDDQQLAGTRNNLENIKNKLRLVQSCLQGLIWGSSANWAHDTNLLHMILSLGKYLEKVP